MIIFDNHKIEWKFADLLRDDWQSLRERCTHNKMSLDKIAELYSAWKCSGKQLIFNLQQYWADSSIWRSLSPKFLFKIIQFFSKQRTGSKVGVIKNTNLKEFVKFPGKMFDWIFYEQSLRANLILPQACSCKFMIVLLWTTAFSQNFKIRQI